MGESQFDGRDYSYEDANGLVAEHETYRRAKQLDQLGWGRVSLDDGDVQARLREEFLSRSV